MDANELRAMQAPIKDRYRPIRARRLITLALAFGPLDDQSIACCRDRPRACRRGSASGDRRIGMEFVWATLEALVACAAA